MMILLCDSIEEADGGIDIEVFFSHQFYYNNTIMGLEICLMEKYDRFLNLRRLHLLHL